LRSGIHLSASVSKQHRCKENAQNTQRVGNHCSVSSNRQHLRREIC